MFDFILLLRHNDISVVQWLACLGCNSLPRVQILAWAVGLLLTQLFILHFRLFDEWIYLRVPGQGRLLTWMSHFPWVLRYPPLTLKCKSDGDGHRAAMAYPQTLPPDKFINVPCINITAFTHSIRHAPNIARILLITLLAQQFSYKFNSSLHIYFHTI